MDARQLLRGLVALQGMRFRDGHYEALFELERRLAHGEAELAVLRDLEHAWSKHLGVPMVNVVLQLLDVTPVELGRLRATLGELWRVLGAVDAAELAGDVVALGEKLKTTRPAVLAREASAWLARHHGDVYYAITRALKAATRPA